jgi:hypothetical protein
MSLIGKSGNIVGVRPAFLIEYFSHVCWIYSHICSVTSVPQATLVAVAASTSLPPMSCTTLYLIMCVVQNNPPTARPMCYIIAKTTFQFHSH